MNYLPLLFILPVLYWLLLETHWLTIRLPQYVSHIILENAFQAIVSIAPLIIFLALLAKTGFLTAKSDKGER